MVAILSSIALETIHLVRTHKRRGEGLNRCAYAVRTEGGGSRSLRTYCDWVVSNAEIDYLTQVNLCASAGQVNLRMRAGGGGGLVARVRRA